MAIVVCWLALRELVLSLSMPRMGKLSCPPTCHITGSTLCQCPAPSFPCRGKENKDTQKVGGGRGITCVL